MTHNPFFQSHLYSISQLDKEKIELVYALEKIIVSRLQTGTLKPLLQGKILSALFYEPSSRTFASFLSAIQYFGGGFIPFHGMEASSVTKGESFEDTIRTFSHFCNAIVLRHPDKGSSEHASHISSVPIINAGDGGNEHPTQAIMELFTIQSHVHDLANATITILGDLVYGRTIHSLLGILSLFPGITVHVVSPQELLLPRDRVSALRHHGMNLIEHTTIDDRIWMSDVFYVNRIKKEKFKDQKDYEKIRNWFRITPDSLKKMKQTAIVMHPLPRADEIDTSVDTDPRAVYLTEQLDHMVTVRMALLAMILHPDPIGALQE